MISLAFLYFFLPLFMAAYAVLPGALRGKFVALTGAGIIAWQCVLSQPIWAAYL